MILLTAGARDLPPSLPHPNLKHQMILLTAGAHDPSWEMERIHLRKDLRNQCNAHYICFRCYPMHMGTKYSKKKVMEVYVIRNYRSWPWNVFGTKLYIFIEWDGLHKLDLGNSWVLVIRPWLPLQWGHLKIFKPFSPTCIPPKIGNNDHLGTKNLSLGICFMCWGKVG